MSDIALFTFKIISNYTNLINYSLLISESNKSTTYCKNKAEDFSSHIFMRAELEDYLDLANQCFSFLSDINTSLLCGVCDPDPKTQQSINLNKKSVM